MLNNQLKNIWSNEKLREFIRFCIIGGASTLLNYGIYVVLIKLILIDAGWWPSVAYTMGYILSWLFNFWFSARFTFRTDVSFKRGVGFAVSHAITYALHVGLLNLFIYIGVPPEWAPIPMYCIAVPTNFILVRIVFRKL